MTDGAANEPPAVRGVVTVASPYGHAATLARIEATIRARGLDLVATIDHAAAAAGVGLALPPTTVLVFGNPRVGTPLMLAAPLLALDLPLKLLVREDAAGTTWVSCDGPGVLAERYGIPVDRAAGISGAPALVAAALAG